MEKSEFQIVYTRPNPKDRMCLMCQQMFDSDGPGHRICKECKGSKTWNAGITDVSIDRERS